VWRAYKENHVHLIGKATFKDQHNQISYLFCIVFIFSSFLGDLIFLGGKKIFLLLNHLKLRAFTPPRKMSAERRAPTAALHRGHQLIVNTRFNALQNRDLRPTDKLVTRLCGVVNLASCVPLLSWYMHRDQTYHGKYLQNCL